MMADKKGKKNLGDKNSYLKVLTIISTFVPVANLGESLNNSFKTFHLSLDSVSVHAF